MKNTIKNQSIVRNTEKGFDIIKMDRINIGKRKNKIERYIATLSDGTQRNFKRCIGECGEMLTYESFPNNHVTRDGHLNVCRNCRSESSRKRQAKLMAQVNENEKRTCSVCNEDKRISEYNTKGYGYRKECKRCQYKEDRLRAHARKSRKLGLHVKLEGEGMEEFRNIVMDAACILTGSFENVSSDHIIPTSLTGGSHISNLLPIRRELNASKGALPFFLWVRTKNFCEIAKKYDVRPERVEFFIDLAAKSNCMTSDQYERYTLWVWKMQQDKDTKHITANPTFSEASDYGTGELCGFSHDGAVYYRPTVTDKERAEIYANFDAEQAN
ncbi:HNH endonuclease [Bacillus mycoides]|uniref:HNH endonuclease n=1 Tax=Bacillus mycoides TaxID=1405 RepID=UPI001C02A8A7|nr:HNH endonuclease [Bacillus mycoides]QWH80356.1 hypothetical protein EXW59_27995 [Bacillus mycoides]QWI45446.1 hypothetical protein EXW55_21495 [Bacillus mycoides]